MPVWVAIGGIFAVSLFLLFTGFPVFQFSGFPGLKEFKKSKEIADAK